MAADVMIIVGIEEVRVDEEEVHGEVVELYLHHHLRLRVSGPRSSNPRLSYYSWLSVSES